MAEYPVVARTRITPTDGEFLNDEVAALGGRFSPDSGQSWNGYDVSEIELIVHGRVRRALVGA